MTNNRIHITKFNLLTINLLIIIFISCDPLTKSVIINDCKSDIEIELYFDKELLDSTSHGTKSYIHNLNDYGCDNLSHKISLDSINFISKYRISST